MLHYILVASTREKLRVLSIFFPKLFGMIIVLKSTEVVWPLIPLIAGIKTYIFFTTKHSNSRNL